MIQPNISIYFDKRRSNNEGRFPVKLRVYFRNQTRYYPAGLHLTESEFEQSYLTATPKGNNNKELKLKLQSLETRANTVKDKIGVFTFEKFEKKLLRPEGAANNVFYYYSQVIAQLQKEERLTTASNYDLSAKSLKKFLNSKNQKDDILHFEDISTSFLKEYEKWMLADKKSMTTIGVYLRPLRAVFNQAIAEGELPHDVYPFGKRKYQIPAGRNIKKALNKTDLQKLLEFKLPDESILKKARDFWFFSYVASGMNMKDIAELKWENISSDTITYIRSKTKNTTRTNQRPIIVILIPFAQYVIKQYSQERKPNGYVFPILNENMTMKEKVSAVQAFTRYVNQHIKKLAKTLGLPEQISTYWARHSYTTSAIRNGASMEFIQESLGHASMQTTMNYWGGFEERAKREIADKLLNF